MILIKKDNDISRKTSSFCGEYLELLSAGEYQPDIVIFKDIKETKAHFHKAFDEIYLVIDGEIEVETHEIGAETSKKTTLKPNEMILIGQGVHHKISRSSDKNRLCVISKPCYNPNDIYPSEHI